MLRPTVTLYNGMFRVFMILLAVGAGLAVYPHLASEFVRGYTSVVTESREFRSGVVLDMDGSYPSQKMTIYVPLATAMELSRNHRGWANPGAIISVTGNVQKYRGRDEIILRAASQLAACRPPATVASTINSPAQPLHGAGMVLPVLDATVLVGICLTGLALVAMCVFSGSRTESHSLQSAYRFGKGALQWRAVDPVCKAENPLQSDGCAADNARNGNWLLVMRPVTDPVEALVDATTPRYQKQLALAYHLSTHGDAATFAKLHPQEQAAAKILAEGRYPLSAELAAKIRAGQVDGSKLFQDNQQPPKEATATSGSASAAKAPPRTPPVTRPAHWDEGQIGEDEPLSPEQVQGMRQANDRDRETYPRSIPRPLSPTEPSPNHGNGDPKPSDSLTNPRPEHWDEGQVGENEPISFSEWRAIDQAHDAMRSSFPRSTPPVPGQDQAYRDDGPPPSQRELQRLNEDHRVNRQAKQRALSRIRPTGLFSEGAIFVGRDANRAILTRRHDGFYGLSYFDSGASRPWRTARYSSLETAVTGATGRQLYYFGTS